MRKYVLEECRFPLSYNESLLKITETLANSKSNGNCVFKGEGACEVSNKISTIVPIVGNRERMGTLLLARFGEEFTDEDLVLAEHSTTIVGMEMLRAKQDELKKKLERKL